VKVLLSWSSGKDSAWALHAVRRDVLEAQAAATGLPLRVVPIPHPCPNDIYEERLAGSGLLPLVPVWGIPTSALAEQMLDGGVRARLACVDTRVLDASFVGREWDRALPGELPAGVDPCGENGEFHTCVYAGPMFRQPLVLDSGEIVTREPFTWADLKVA
jgi:diphthamide synthase (EF-2-diphthine--ammonia ligase)